MLMYYPESTRLNMRVRSRLQRQNSVLEKKESLWSQDDNCGKMTPQLRVGTLPPFRGNKFQLIISSIGVDVL